MLNQIKITTDYHMHSTYSPDGDDPPAVLCRQALALGFSEIAITEHAEWHPRSSLTGFPGVTDYFRAMEQVRAEFGPSGLTVHTGVELGNPHQYSEEAKLLLDQYPFEVVIASLHWLYDENIHVAGCFTGREPAQVYTDYFTELGRMAAGFEFDVIAHFDRIIWRGTMLGATFDPWALEPVIRDALAAAAAHNRALELNTRFLDHPHHWNKALVTMLRWFRQAGGHRVVVNSDAHRIAEIGRNLEIAQALLEKAGFDLPGQGRPAVEAGPSALFSPCTRQLSPVWK